MNLLKGQYSFVIFDWDGTLMDSTGRIVSAMQSTAKEANLPIPSEKNVKTIIGLSMDAVMKQLFPTADQQLRNKLFEIYRYQYIEGDKTPSPLFDGTVNLLNWLKSQDIPIAIATGKARVGLERVLNEVNLLSFFDYTICADEASSKPAPQMLERLLKIADKSTCESLLIGDSIHDLKMASNADMDSVGVTSGANSFDELLIHQPKVILEDISHLQEWFGTDSKHSYRRDS